MKSNHRALQGCGDFCYKWTSHSCDKGVSFLLVSKGWCCFCSVTKSCPTLWDPMHCSTPGSSVFHCFLEFAQMHAIELVMLFKYLITWCPFPLLPSTFPSIRVFSSELALHIRWPKYWSFSISISPCNEYSRLISFRIDWFVRAVQGSLKSILQHHNSKASILRHPAFLMVQLLHPYMTNRKTIALTIRTFVDKVMFLLFNMLSRIVIAFLPRSKHVLIS